MAKKKATQKRKATPKTKSTVKAKAKLKSAARKVKAASRGPNIDTHWMVNFLVDLLKIPSPTGYTEAAIDHVHEEFATLRLDTRLNHKGALIAAWKGRSSSRPRAITAHVDTLGAIVKDIDAASGRLKMARIGGYSWSSVETDGCTIFTSGEKTYRGTILPRHSSIHVHGNSVDKQERDDDNMWVRIDARTSSAEQTRGLGIDIGDFIAFDPRVEQTDTGFIRSRHLDDKAGVACIAAAVKALLDAGKRPTQSVTILISNYEEAGHGASTGIPDKARELLTVDMAAVGQGQNSDEFSTGICVKDAGGPYHIEMRRKLVALAKSANIPYKLDIYPHYSSDGEAAWQAGADIMVGLIGPGVESSHSYERTHIDSLNATARLIMEYMMS